MSTTLVALLFLVMIQTNASRPPTPALVPQRSVGCLQPRAVRSARSTADVEQTAGTRTGRGQQKPPERAPLRVLTLPSERPFGADMT